MKTLASSAGSALDMSRYQYGGLYDSRQSVAERGCLRPIHLLDRCLRMCFDFHRKTAELGKGKGIRDHMGWLASSMVSTHLMLSAGLASANWRPEEKQRGLGTQCNQTAPSELAG